MLAVPRFVLGPSRLFHSERQRGLLLAPGCPCLTHGTGPWHAGHSRALRLEAHAQRTATRGLASRDDPPQPRQAPSQTRCHGDRDFHAIAALAIPHPEPQRATAIATHAATPQPLFESIPASLAMPVGGPRGSWCLGLRGLGPRERKRGGGLRPPGRGDGVARQRLAREGAQHRVEMDGTQRIAAVP